MIENLASYLDLANHHPNATEADIRDLCAKVLEHKFNAAFVNPAHIALAKSLGVKVGTVVSFPLGQELLRIKCDSVLEALAVGADELDVSLNVGYIKEANWDKSFEEMNKLVMLVRQNKPQAIIKFIPETGYLTADEIKKTAELILKSGADFFKTCSGLGPRWASVEDVQIVKATTGDQLKIKVAGGITTYDEATKFIEAGAIRIGTSHAVEIIRGATITPAKNQV